MRGGDAITNNLRKILRTGVNYGQILIQSDEEKQPAVRRSSLSLCTRVDVCFVCCSCFTSNYRSASLSNRCCCATLSSVNLASSSLFPFSSYCILFVDAASGQSLMMALRVLSEHGVQVYILFVWKRVYVFFLKKKQPLFMLYRLKTLLWWHCFRLEAVSCKCWRYFLVYVTHNWYFILG